MAKTKKKAKKTAKKKTKKRTAKKPVFNPPVPFGKLSFHRKILSIMGKEDVLNIPVRGESQDREGNEFKFTRAEEVLKIFGNHFRNEGITCMPESVLQAEKIFPQGIIVKMRWRLTDSDTGYSETIEGVGIGTNGIWSANSAATVALKQALLETFVCNWPNYPDHIADKRKQFEAAHKVFEGVDNIGDLLKKIGDTNKAVLEMKEFFGKSLKKA